MTGNKLLLFGSERLLKCRNIISIHEVYDIQFIFNILVLGITRNIIINIKSYNLRNIVV